MRFRFVKKILRIIALILPCFAFSFFFSSDSFAISTSYTVNSSNISQSHYICYENDNTLPWCSTLPYLRISFNNISSPSSFASSYSAARVNLLFQFNYKNGLGNNTFTCHVVNSSCTFHLLSGIESISYQSFTNGSSFISSGSVTIEMSDSPFSSGIVPSGSISLSSNGTYDVTSYSEAVVDVPPVPGDYHDDLVNVRNAILICGAILLVIYFFYAIYKMILGGSR